MAEPLSAAPSRRSWLLPLAYGALVFLPMLRNQFWLDDYGWVSSAMDGLRHPAHLIELAKTDFRPLVNLTFALNFLVSGLNPVGYYLLNLALHLANTWLVMRLAERVSRDATVALVTGFLFAGAFANYGQAVVWISGRTGLLADLLIFACLLAHLSWLEGRRPRDRTWTMVWFALALLTKESAVVLVPLMLLVEWAHGRRPRELLSFATVRAYAPFAVVLLAYLGFQFGIVRKDSPILESEYRLGWHVVTNFAEYLARLVIPVNATTMMVSVPAGLRAALAVAQTALMIVLPALGIVLLLRPVPRWVKFGVVWTAISLLPYVAFTFRTSTRYQYGPSVGLALVVAWLLSPAWTGVPATTRGRIARATLVALLLVQAVVINVVIYQHYRAQRSQDPKPYQELLEQRRTGAVGGTTMKTIGVIGGIGPQATMDFEARVHRVAQRRIPPHFNSGYPPMVVVYHRRAPVILGPDQRPQKPYRPDPGFLEAARTVGAAADFVVIASNFPHVFQPQVEQAAGRPVVSMIDVTLAAVQARGWRRVGVVGLGVPIIYTDRLAGLGIPHELLDQAARDALDHAILTLMEGREDEAMRRTAREALATLRARGVDGIILGCTEIPLLLGDAADAPDLVNPAQELAEAAVARALE